MAYTFISDVFHFMFWKRMIFRSHGHGKICMLKMVGAVPFCVLFSVNKSVLIVNHVLSHKMI